MRYSGLSLITFALIGCAQKPADQSTPSTPSTLVGKSGDEGGHSHEKGKMMLADAGRYHALLTAHLSKDGHELDLFFETVDPNPKPVALPLTVLKASIQVRVGTAN